MSKDEPQFETRVVGRHLVQIEPPDIVFATFRGQTSVAEVEEFKRIFTEVEARFGPFYFLVDARALADLEPGARAAWARTAKPLPFRHVVAFGARFATRVLMQTVAQAGRILAPKSFQWCMDFADNEASARARIKKLQSLP